MADVIKGVKIRFGVDNKAANAELKKTQTSMQSVTKSVKNMALSFVGITAVVAGLTKSIKLAVDAEETHSKLLAVFSNQTSEVSAVVKDLADNYIMSTAGAEKMVAATGDILTGFGFTQKSALELSEKVAKLGADLASFTNIEGGAEKAVTALTAAMVGETERAKALGIVIRQDSKRFKELVKEGISLRGETLLQSKAMAALTIATEQSKNAINDVARTYNSTANKIKRFQADIENISTKIGGVFVGVIVESLATLNDLKVVILGIGGAWGTMLVIGKIKAFFSTLSMWTVASKIALINLKAVILGIGGVAIIAASVISRAVLKASEEARSEMIKLGNLRGKMFNTWKRQTAFEKKARADAQKLAIKFVDGEIARGIKIEDRQQAIIDQTNKLFKLKMDTLDVSEKETLAEEKSKKVTDSKNKTLTLAEQIQEAYNKQLNKTLTNEEKVALGVKKLIDAKKKAIKVAKEKADADKKELKITKEKADADEKARKELLLTLPILKDTTEAIKEYAPEVEEATEETEDLGEATKKTSSTFENIQSAVFGAVNVFESLGIVSGEAANKLGGFASAGIELAKAFGKGGTMADKINAVANALAEVGAAIVDWLTGDGVGEAIERENSWMDITEKLEEQLRELEDQLGSTHAATSVMLDELMKGEVTLKNSDKWLYRIRETLSDVEQGTLSGTEAVKAMGKSFEVWLVQAKKLGTTGSQVFFDLVGDLQNRGLEVTEINDFILDSIKQGFEGKNYFVGYYITYRRLLM